MTKVLIRVDGDANSGLGHLVRCFALALMLKGDFDPVFYCKEIPAELFEELVKNGFRLNKIADNNDFLEQIHGNNIVVLDGYHFDTLFQKQIKDKGVKLVCIDDLHDKKFLADLVINHSNGISFDQYNAEPFTQFALGLDYALLRPAFLNQAKNKRSFCRIESMMICFGGSDFKNYTQRALEAALSFPQLARIIVVTGPAYEVTEEFLHMINSDSRVFHRHALSETQMLETMLETDIVIVPASSILLEVMAAGCKIISGLYIENQKYIYDNLLRANVFFNAGSFSINELKNAISLALGNNYHQQHHIDGESAIRVKKLFNQIEIEFSVNLRVAEARDRDVTYAWASDPLIRQFSFTKHEITREEHTKWFLNKCGDLNCCYLIVEYGYLAVGSVRFDLENETALISYLLDPLFHGRGFGQIILKKGIEWLLVNNKIYPAGQIKVIAGIVMKNNIPSVKSFERLGFHRKVHEENYIYEKWVS